MFFDSRSQLSLSLTNIRGIAINTGNFVNIIGKQSVSILVSSDKAS